jgi:hypothetical protein
MDCRVKPGNDASSFRDAPFARTRIQRLSIEIPGSHQRPALCADHCRAPE